MSLARRLDEALSAGPRALDELVDVDPVDHRDVVESLLTIHDLHTAPIERLGDRVRWQHHPAVETLKELLETSFLLDIELADVDQSWDLPDDPVGAMRALAVIDQIPDVYRWVADDGSLDEIVAFLTLEGGPDGGFDDLVAACQIGIAGVPKVEMAQNYWDEMGRGRPDDVHTGLHHRMVRALGVEAVPRDEQPIEALERAALGSTLATNRWLQPEMVGALGLIELQAGPRCRKVIAGLKRVDAPADALPFYEEHAVADPRHGKDWLDKVVAPLAEELHWGERIVRGARWRSIVNARFFDAMADRFVLGAAKAV